MFHAWFGPNAPLAKKPFGMIPMILLGKWAQMEARFGLFGDSANLDARFGAWFASNIPYDRKSIWTLASVYLEIALVSMQDRCTVCT